MTGYSKTIARKQQGRRAAAIVVSGIKPLTIIKIHGEISKN